MTVIIAVVVVDGQFAILKNFALVLGVVFKFHVYTYGIYVHIWDRYFYFLYDTKFQALIGGLSELCY